MLEKVSRVNESLSVAKEYADSADNWQAKEKYIDLLIKHDKKNEAINVLRILSLRMENTLRYNFSELVACREKLISLLEK